VTTFQLYFSMFFYFCAMASHFEPDCFHLISREELDSLSDKRSLVSYLKGETVFKQGALAPHVLFVQSGLVKVYLQTGPRRVQNLWIARSGEFLAFSSLFDKKVYPYSAQALKDSRLMMIDKESLGKLLRTHPEFAFRITSKHFASENHLLEIISSLSFKQMRGKLATVLLYLASVDSQGEDVFAHLTRQDIAGFAAISVESVIKFLKEFEKEGLVSVEGRLIGITDRQGLMRLSETA
jgi:CRP-like cAMP-binding protein